VRGGPLAEIECQLGEAQTSPSMLLYARWSAQAPRAAVAQSDFFPKSKVGWVAGIHLENWHILGPEPSDRLFTFLRHLFPKRACKLEVVVRSRWTCRVRAREYITDVGGVVWRTTTQVVPKAKGTNGRHLSRNAKFAGRHVSSLAAQTFRPYERRSWSQVRDWLVCSFEVSASWDGNRARHASDVELSSLSSDGAAKIRRGPSLFAP
jgi:hypothetical protein